MLKIKLSITLGRRRRRRRQERHRPPARPSPAWVQVAVDTGGAVIAGVLVEVVARLLGG